MRGLSMAGYVARLTLRHLHCARGVRDRALHRPCCMPPVASAASHRPRGVVFSERSYGEIENNVDASVLDMFDTEAQARARAHTAAHTHARTALDEFAVDDPTRGEQRPMRRIARATYATTRAVPCRAVPCRACKQSRRRCRAKPCHAMPMPQKLGLRGVTIVVASGDDGANSFKARENAIACFHVPLRRVVKCPFGLMSLCPFGMMSLRPFGVMSLRPSGARERERVPALAVIPRDESVGARGRRDARAGGLCGRDGRDERQGRRDHDRRRCASPSADVAGLSPVLVQMWHG